MKNKTFFRLLIISILSTAVLACSETPIPLERIALRGVTVIDGRGNPPVPDQVVILREDRIEQIIGLESYEPAQDTQVMDLAGHYVMPGLIDMHAHVAVLTLEALEEPRARAHLDVSKQVLEMLLTYGVTTVRNPAAPTEDGVLLRDSVASGQIPGPRILTSGYVLNRGTFGPYLNMRTEADVREEIARQAEAGVDYVKVYIALPPDLIRIAIEEAHARNLKVVGHLQRTTWTEGARFGIDAITHGAPWSVAYLPKDKQRTYVPTLKGRTYWLQHLDLASEPVQEMVAALVENNVTIDPTLIVYHTKFWGDDDRYLKHPELNKTPDLILDIWRTITFTFDWTEQDYTEARAVWPKLQRFVKLLYDSGVLLTAGTDLPNPWVIPGISMHEELRLLAEIGIPNIDVLKIATYNGAVALGLDADIGSVEPGKQADLLVLTQNPVQDLRNTRSIKWVVQSGNMMDPTALMP